MDWEQVLAYVIESVCGLIISVGIPLLLRYISIKVNNEHVTLLIKQACDIVEKCVIMVDQIYVDALKREGKFDKESQEIALNMCKEQVLNMLNEEAKKVVIDTFGNFEEWLTVYIESCVRTNALLKKEA